MDKIKDYQITLLDEIYDEFLLEYQSSGTDNKMATFNKTLERKILDIVESKTANDLKQKASDDVKTLTETFEEKIKGKEEEEVAALTTWFNDSKKEVSHYEVTEQMEIQQDKVIERLFAEIKEKFANDKNTPIVPKGKTRVESDNLIDMVDKLFSGIKLNHMRITLSDMLKPINADGISTTLANPVKTYNTRKTMEKVEDGLFEAKTHPILLRNIELIDKKLPTLEKTSDNTTLRIKIQNNINQLMGQLPQHTKAEKETIYDYWKGMGTTQYKNFETAGDELDKALGQSDFTKIWQQMKQNKTLNYIHKFDGIDVINDDDEKTTLNLLVGFLNRRNAGLILEDEERDAKALEEEADKDEKGKDSDIQEERNTLPPTVSRTQQKDIDFVLGTSFKQVDILTAIYVDSFLGGAVINTEAEKKKIIGLLNSYGEKITLPTRDKEDLTHFIENLREIEVYKGETFVPLQILDRNYLSKNYTKDATKRVLGNQKIKSHIANYSNINEDYVELFDAISHLITTSRGQRAATIHEPTYTKVTQQKGTEPKDAYKQMVLSRRTKFKPQEISEEKEEELRGRLTDIDATKNEVPPEQYEERSRDLTTQIETIENMKLVYKFIKEMEAYIITPILNSKMNMGIPFEFKDSIGFQTVARFISEGTYNEGLKVIDKDHKPNISGDLQLYTALYDAHEERGGMQLKGSDLTNIKDFLTLLSKDFLFSDLQKATYKLGISLNNMAGNRKLSKENRKAIRDNINRELAAYLGGVATVIEGKGATATAFNKLSPIEEYKSNPVDGIGEIKSFAIIKDFLIANQKTLKAGQHDKVGHIVRLFEELRKADSIASKILSAHDSFRIIKGMPVYYGLKSPYCFDGMNNSIDSIKNKFAVDITAMEVNYILEEIDSFSNIAKSVGVSEELVYYVKADFR